MEFLIGLYVFAVGAAIGSFLNVCIGRWPEGLSVVRPRSRCPKCGHRIKASENIPILSWLMLRGRCSNCHERISIQYPIVELAVAWVWLDIYFHYGLTFTAFRIAVFGTVLLGIAITDAKHFLIPDGFTVFGLFFVLLTGIIALYFGEAAPFARPWDAVLGMCVGAGAISIVGWLGEVWLKRPAMGFGDVTLMAVVGARARRRQRSDRAGARVRRWMAQTRAAFRRLPRARRLHRAHARRRHHRVVPANLGAVRRLTIAPFSTRLV